MITPPLKLSIIDFHLGYGYNYSTSDENRFEADKSLYDIVTLTNPRNGISGSYQPYFTPNNQQIHSAIASVGLHFSNKIQFNLKASYGFYATSLSPYLYVDKDESNNDYLVKGFYNNIYSPLEISLGLNFKMSNKVNLNAEVIYNKTDYYKNLYLTLGIKKSF